MIKSSKINREKINWLLAQPLETKVNLINHHMEIVKIMVNSVLEEEVVKYAGERYSHNKPEAGKYSRWGYNPGSVKVGTEKLRVDIPRIRNNDTEKFVSLTSPPLLKQLPDQEADTVNAVLHGLSTRDYKKIFQHLADSFGLSSSTVSRNFIERSRKALEEFEQRKLDQDFVAIFIDGKELAKQQMVIALGVTSNGHKIPIGVVQTTTENSKSISELFRDLIDRGLKYDDGLLFVIDGAKGLRKAIQDVFAEKAVIQRCQWHKRENVISYLTEDQQEVFKRKLQAAYSKEDYKQVKEELLMLKKELGEINRSAARSLEEGMEETLTIQRLQLHFNFHRSFSTTNCIENVNSQLGKYIRNVKRWTNSDQRYRWVVSGLLEVEQKMRKVSNYKMLKKMKQAIKDEVNRKIQSNDQKAA